jgi:MoaA/NifB/PqqE/SkfB family radical SAM enzyme
MAGAMAGTAILMAPTVSSSLHTVTLTINNVCNLSCPHCYLQYEGSRAYIPNETIEYIFGASFSHLAIVGKEPLVNNQSAQICSHLIGRARRRGISVSLITNGFGLQRLTDESLDALSWIDVSLYRDSSSVALPYRKRAMAPNVTALEALPIRIRRHLRMLFTIHSDNWREVEQIADIAMMVGAEFVSFSPYQRTKSDGQQSVTMVEPYRLIEAMVPLCGHPAKWKLIVDSNYLASSGIHQHEFLKSAKALGERLVLVSGDPLERGILRVTYDGLVLSPNQSIHTNLYSRSGVPLVSKPLEQHYLDLRRYVRLHA